jgi:hypothetical protein
MELSEHNVAQLRNWVIRKSRITDLPNVIDASLIQNLDNERAQRCCICLEIARFPIIFPCGHFECSACHVGDFTARAIRRGSLYYSPCPLCRADVSPFKAHTLQQEIALSSSSSADSSNVVRFYSELRVHCSNAGCDKTLPYAELNRHEMLLCAHRIIQCPARHCPCYARPDVIIAHTINCPLHYTWCAHCHEGISVTVAGHSCEKILQRSILLGKYRTKEDFHLADIHAEKHGNIILPQLIAYQFRDQTDLLVIRDAAGLLSRTAPAPPPPPPPPNPLTTDEAN